MYYIGVDLGTSAVKLLLMEESGKIEKIVSREYPLYFPPSGLVGAESGRLDERGNGRDQRTDI